MPKWSQPNFEWDEGNIEHLITRHDVYPTEAEEVFYRGAYVRRDGDVYIALGQDDGDRYLFLVCIERGATVRVISARPMNLKERKAYERFVRTRRR